MVAVTLLPMDDFDGVLNALSAMVDSLTLFYRLAHSLTQDADGVPTVLVGPLTWVLGTALTALVLWALVGAWCVAARSCHRGLRRCLIVATRGLGPYEARRYATTFARFERAAFVAQSMARNPFSTRLGSAGRTGFVEPSSGTVQARAALQLLAATRWPAVLLRMVVSVPGAMSLAATWWAVGAPGGEGILAVVRRVTRSDLSPTPTAVAAVATTVAILTFLLGRMRTARSVGHQAWRRDHVTRSSDVLADREVLLANAAYELEIRIDQSCGRWHSFIYNAGVDADTAQKALVGELRRRAGVTPTTEALRHVRGESMDPVQPERDDRHVEALRAHLDAATDRVETDMRRAVPWRVVRLASRTALERSVRDIDWFLAEPAIAPVQLAPIDLCVPQLVRGSGRAGSTRESWESALIDLPADDWDEVVTLAATQWREQAAESSRRHTEIAHRRLIDALVATAQLEAAADAIFRYRHRAGPVAKLLERARPS